MANLTVSANVDSIMGAADYAAIRTLLGLDPLACRVNGATTKNIPNNTVEFAIFDSEIRDDGGFADLGTNNTRLTIPTGQTGWYHISGQVFIGTVATGTSGTITATNYTTFIRKNGSVFICQIRLGVNNLEPGFSLSTLDYLTAGDYVEIGVFHNQGTTLKQRTESGQQAYFAIAKVG